MVKMRSFFILFIVFAFGLSSCVWAQDKATWIEVELSKKVGDFNYSANQEYRSSNSFSTLRGHYSTLEVQYKVARKTKLGLSYQYIYFNDIEDGIVNHRNRINLFGEYKINLGRFELGIKERFQWMHKSTELYVYKINPSKKWRNKVSLEYDIPRSKLTPKYSFETFYDLNGLLGKGFNGSRHKLAVQYKITSQYTLGLFGLLDQEPNKENLSVFGITSKYKL